MTAHILFSLIVVIREVGRRTYAFPLNLDLERVLRFRRWGLRQHDDLFCGYLKETRGKLDWWLTVHNSFLGDYVGGGPAIFKRNFSKPEYIVKQSRQILELHSIWLVSRTESSFKAAKRMAGVMAGTHLWGGVSSINVGAQTTDGKCLRLGMDEQFCGAVWVFLLGHQVRKMVQRESPWINRVTGPLRNALLSMIAYWGAQNAF